jgi:thioredoxin-dependent peroxiredoxin
MKEMTHFEIHPEPFAPVAGSIRNKYKFMKPLAIGSTAPDFSLLDQNGQAFTLSEALKAGPVVLYFYPKDETLGCTKQACGFRDRHEGFLAKDAKVVGVSADSVASHQQFIAHRQLPFTLLSDPDKALHRLYGVGTGILGIMTSRLTFVIDQRGIIRSRTDSVMDVEGHARESLKMLDKF